MINVNRIVPVQAIDLISLYGLILLQNSSNSGLTAAEAKYPGVFEITDATNVLIANEPVATCDFAEDVTAATIYFVPAYNYTGFTLNGATAIINAGSDDVEADGRTLYKAVLATGEITITRAGF
jgi:hypothetical protein